MTNRESYLDDLDEIQRTVNALLQMVPMGKTKREKKSREHAEELASRIRTIAHLMENDYIPYEF